jgi:glycosyltransferase involved in cell wall biosynthesis
MVSGAAVVAEYLANEMSARGHHVLVITASDRGRGYVTEQPCLRVVRLKSRRNPFRSQQRYATFPFRRIRQELEAFQPDIIHTHDPLNYGIAGILASRRLQSPVVMTAHQLPWFVMSYMPEIPLLKQAVEAMLWGYGRWLSANVQLPISPSATVARKMEEYSGFRTVTIGNGIDTERFQPNPTRPQEREMLCAQYGLDPAKPIILHVGRLDQEKKVDVALKAAAKAMHNSDAQLLIAGDGCQREELVQLAGWLGIAERTRFPGFVSAHGDLPGLYRLATVFITASEIEVHPLVLLEAMSSGVPIVAARATSIPEMVHHGVNGYLAPPGDTNALAEYLVDVIINPALAAQLGAAGHQLACQYSLQRFLEQHEAAYKRLIEELIFPRKLVRQKIRELFHSF